jgi:hypothetical protein
MIPRDLHDTLVMLWRDDPDAISKYRHSPRYRDVIHEHLRQLTIEAEVRAEIAQAVREINRETRH